MTTQQLVVQNELSSYYLRVADDYRERYLETERQLIAFKEHSKTKLDQAVSLVEQRMQHMMQEEREEYVQRLSEAKKETEGMRQRVSELELEK
jgi:hypothetical protein